MACSKLRKGNLKRETESLSITAQNNDISTNYIKAKIDNNQKSRKCRFCGDRDEMVNRIISECSKLVPKDYKTRHDWVGKEIYWELCKGFNYADNWCMHKPESVWGNDTNKILWDLRYKQITQPQSEYHISS